MYHSVLIVSTVCFIKKSENFIRLPAAKMKLAAFEHKSSINEIGTCRIFLIDGGCDFQF
jgi:hypothetical protein